MATPKDAGRSRFHEQPWLPLLTEVRKFARNPPDWAWMREGLQTLITEPVYSVGRKSVSAATVKLVGLTIRALADQFGFVENITQDRIASYASVERSTVTRAVAVLNAAGYSAVTGSVGAGRPATRTTSGCSAPRICEPGLPPTNAVMWPQATTQTWPQATLPDHRRRARAAGPAGPSDRGAPGPLLGPATAGRAFIAQYTMWVALLAARSLRRFRPLGGTPISGRIHQGVFVSHVRQAADHRDSLPRADGPAQRRRGAVRPQPVPEALEGAVRDSAHRREVPRLQDGGGGDRRGAGARRRVRRRAEGAGRAGAVRVGDPPRRPPRRDPDPDGAEGPERREERRAGDTRRHGRRRGGPVRGRPVPDVQPLRGGPALEDRCPVDQRERRGGHQGGRRPDRGHAGLPAGSSTRAASTACSGCRRPRRAAASTRRR